MDLINLSNKYVEYLNTVGASLEAIKTSVHPFALNCSKVINGTLVVTNAEQFKEQLWQVREPAGRWQVELIECLPCADNKTAVVRYDIVAENAGGFHVIAILRYNQNGLLEEVNEVYHPNELTM